MHDSCVPQCEIRLRDLIPLPREHVPKAIYRTREVLNFIIRNVTVIGHLGVHNEGLCPLQ